MPLADAYTTTDALKAYLRIPLLGDTEDDLILDAAIEAASRGVDLVANRRFGKDAAAVERRYTWRPGREVDGLESVPVTDIADATGIIVRFVEDGVETVLGADEFALWPLNAAVDGWPYERVVLTPDATRAFPRGLGEVHVTAVYGWPTAVPEGIAKATKVQAARLVKRRDAPFGVAGSPDLGSELRLLSKLDPDVELIVRAFRREWAVA